LVNIILHNPHSKSKGNVDMSKSSFKMWTCPHFIILYTIKTSIITQIKHLFFQFLNAKIVIIQVGLDAMN